MVVFDVVDLFMLGNGWRLCLRTDVLLDGKRKTDEVAEFIIAQGIKASGWERSD